MINAEQPDLVTLNEVGDDDMPALDGGVMHVVATPEFVVDTSRTIELRIDVEHPGLLVNLAPGTP